MQVGMPSDHPPARRAHDVTLLDQVRLEHVLDGVTLLADRRGQVVDPTGPPSNFSIMVSSKRRSEWSKPRSSTSSRFSAMSATALVICPLPRTSA